LGIFSHHRSHFPAEEMLAWNFVLARLNHLIKRGTLAARTKYMLLENTQATR
jgi:hypothetical protein